MIKVALIDDHDIVRMGLKAMIEFSGDMKFAGELPNGSGAAEFAKKVKADVVLLDIRMPEVDGLTALADLRANAPGVKVMMLTTSDVADDVRTALRLGVDGYVLKSTPPGEIVGMIRRVAAGEKVFPPNVQQIIKLADNIPELSSREMEVLRLIERGCTNAEIGGVLGVAAETAKSHIKHIFMKLDCADRAEAVSKAYSLGLLKLAALAGALLIPAVSPAVTYLFDDAYTSDPAPVVEGGRLYLYTGHDADDADEFKNPDWRLYSTTNGSDWTSHGAVAYPTTHPWGTPNTAWASHAVAKGGRYYLYTSTGMADGRMAIGVQVASRPEGPFADPIGKPIVDHPGCFGDYDPNVFIDDDGTAYLFWGNFALHCAKLNADMTSVDKSFGNDGIKILEAPVNYLVGPWVWKREGMYYLAYVTDAYPAGTAYATAPSATGPWKHRGWIMAPDARSSGTQPAVVDFNGKHLFFGWNRTRYESRVPAPRPHRELRSVCVTALDYNGDGTIRLLPWWDYCQPPFPASAR